MLKREHHKHTFIVLVESEAKGLLNYYFSPSTVHCDRLLFQKYVCAGNDSHLHARNSIEQMLTNFLNKKGEREISSRISAITLQKLRERKRVFSLFELKCLNVICPFQHFNCKLTLYFVSKSFQGSLLGTIVLCLAS
jgi:hypothetical protein